MRKSLVALVALAALAMTTEVVASPAENVTLARRGTVRGTVRSGGAPLPGVEVFLWAGFPRFDCTNARGQFSFANVPFGVDLSAATGTGSPQRCDNWRFLTPKGRPLLTQFYKGSDGVADFDVFRLRAANPTKRIRFTPRPAVAGERVCDGMLPTITGTPRGEVLTGTAGDDVIDARGGNDIIRGRAGFDQICGGAGNDIVSAGAGGDRVIGGLGHDKLRGGGGDDELRGEKGNDQLRGERGNDTLFGGAHRDHCWGGTGSDRGFSCEVKFSIP